MFQFLPYGASAKITCTKSSKKGQLVNTYTSSTNYTTSYQEIGLNGSYFLLSNKEPIEMEYSYSSNNGKLVEIITNFEVIADEVNIRNDGNGHYSIINSNWINSGSGSFKISNEAWFNNGRQEEPYIKLCFNKVQVECCFTNPWASASTHPTRSENGWKGLGNNVGDSQLRPYSESAQNYCTLARYITVSWNTSENNGNLFKGQYKNDTHWYQGWFSYGEANGTIRDFNYKISGTNDTTQRLWTTTGADAFNFTAPPLNGTGNINGIVPYNYFKIGYTINFAGESSWQPASTLSINENNYIYDTKGFIYKQTINSNINSVNSTPTLYSHPSTDNWSNNSRFYQTNNGKYVSPSDGLQITSKWTTSSYCIPYTPCDCYSCDCYSCDCDSCDGGGNYMDVRAGTYNECIYTGQAYNDGWDHTGTIGYVPAGRYPYFTTTYWTIFEYNGHYWN